MLMNGYKVYVARDGMSALASARAFLPDLILLDILLPHVDGFQVCETLRHNPTYENLPIVMMTALKTEADKERAYTAGANDYVTKPFTEERLLATIRHHLDAVKSAGCIP